MSAILAIVHRTFPVFKLERELDGSNPFMNFGRDLIENKSDNGQTDRQAENNGAPPTPVGVGGALK